MELCFFLRGGSDMQPKSKCQGSSATQQKQKAPGPDVPPSSPL